MITYFSCTPVRQGMNQKEGGENGKHIKSAHTVFDIIEFIKQNEGSTVSELTDELKYSKSTIYYYLQTLESRRYVVNEQGTYYLSLRFFDLGDHAISRHQPPSLVENEVDKLSEKTGQTAFFAVEESGKGMYVYQTDPQVLSQGDQTGIEHYLHASASGKAILARLSETEVSNIIEQHRLPAVTISRRSPTVQSPHSDHLSPITDARLPDSTDGQRNRRLREISTISCKFRSDSFERKRQWRFLGLYRRPVECDNTTHEELCAITPTVWIWRPHTRLRRVRPETAHFDA